jgi:hypothetical protein|tara:strand:+ start:557 stop:1252 length:696 start_codon:yes stop_codon:yes gene_type:complete
MSTFFSELVDKFAGKEDAGFLDFITSKGGSALTGLGISALGNKFAPDYFNPQTQPTGYQGEIPRYAAVREQVAMPKRQPIPESGIDPNRRPGSTGRRYFSDTIYAKQPETSPMSIAEARAKAKKQAEGIAALQGGTGMAAGGILALREGRYLDGSTDGMADKVPARIDNGQEARLSDGEFVIPADVVSHLGNGNSDAGARVLHDMMNRVRKERTGNEKQGKEVDPMRMLPA